ncbi:MAG: type II toxin-antitoxin system RelE/ParE family toxin [Acidobacteriota bacterium]
MKIVWTKEAVHRLEEIEEYIAKDRPMAAEALIDDIIARVESLSDAPHKGRMVPELSHPNIREVIYKNYRIVYIVRRKSLNVITIFEGHKLLKLP